MRYDVGDSVKLTAAFTDDTGAAADPTDVNATLRSPSEAEAGYVLADFTRPSLGAFELVVIATESGTWTWRIAGTGVVTAASEGQFYVVESEF